MALKIWLPLNGDLHNQGLNNITVTNNGATVNNSGKIGKCYSFNGPSQKISTNISPAVTSAIGSLACWVKFSSLPSSSDWFCLMQLGALGGFASCRLGVYFEKATGINISINGSSTGANYQAYTFSTGVWYHICVTYDGSKVKLYINGQEKMNKAAKLGSYTTTASNLFIGGTNSYWIKGYMNDIRYYDHALSVKEIEEIAKGLVLHYKLDSYETETTTNLCSQLVKGGRTNIVNNTVQNTGENADTYWYIKPKEALVGGATYTVSCNCTGFSSSSTYLAFGVGAQSGANSAGTWKIYNGYNSFTFVMPSGRDGSTENFIFDDCGGTRTEIFTLSNIQLEKKDHATPFVQYGTTRTPTTIYDCSGYRNNGTIVGNLTAAAGSPRYQVCTHFNGVDNCIITPYNGIVSDNIFTINLWFCKDALGSKNYETLFGGPSGFEMDTRSGGSSSMALYMASVRGGIVYSGADFTFNKWIMVTMVRDGTNELYYINGELKKTIEAKSMPTGIYRIGAWASNDRQNFYGDMSDFRIYTTVLSAEQIKELYTTSLKIVSGNPVARELSEL